MVSTKPRDYLIGSVIDHCLSFSDHLEPLKSRQYVSDFPKTLIEALAKLNLAIKNQLESRIHDPDFLSLTEEEAEDQILRYCILYTYLFNTASIIERSDVPHTIVELVQPIKRLMYSGCGLKKSELLLHSLPEMNYSFYPLGSELAGIKKQLNIRKTIIFPQQLIAIGFPGPEIGQILTHSVIAHELGHYLYLEHKLQKRILPLVKPDKNELNELAELLARNAAYTAVQARSRITVEINKLSPNWVKELSSDAIGYQLFGPAFLFAALSLYPMSAPFDYVMGNHPPNRMRFLLLFKMFEDEKQYMRVLNKKARNFLSSWKNYTRAKNPNFTTPVRYLTGNAILAIYDDIIAEAKLVTGSSGSYYASNHANEIAKLIDRASQFITPNELINKRASQMVAFRSILNAAWIAQLSGLDDARKKFKLEQRDINSKFNDIILSAIELNEIHRRWNELK